MKSGIDPKIDYAFKRVFGSEENQNVLRHLLNAVLADSLPRPIRDVQVLNPFSLKDAMDDRLSILDIKARDEAGREYLIEMQLFLHASFPERLLYYGARHYSTQLAEGEDYTRLRPIVVICFVNAVLFPQSPGYHGRYELMDGRQGIRFSDHLAIHVVEIPKFLRRLDELQEDLERWTYFLRHGDELDGSSLPEPLAIPEIAQATGTLTMLSLNDAERDLYEARLMLRRDETARAAYAINKGREEGFRTLLLRMGQRRFGEAPQPIQDRLNAVTDLEQLEFLTERLITIHGWDELFTDAELTEGAS